MTPGLDVRNWNEGFCHMVWVVFVLRYIARIPNNSRATRYRLKPALLLTGMERIERRLKGMFVIACFLKSGKNSRMASDQ